MAHKIKVSGTNYGIKAAKCNISGTNYYIEFGKTKISGTDRLIDFVTGAACKITASGTWRGNYYRSGYGYYVTYEYWISFLNGNSISYNGTTNAKVGQTVKITGSAEKWSSSNFSPEYLQGDGPLRVYYNGDTTYDYGNGGISSTFILTEDTNIECRDGFVYVTYGKTTVTTSGTFSSGFSHPCAGAIYSIAYYNGNTMSAGTTQVAKGTSITVKIESNVAGISKSIVYNGTTKASTSDLSCSYTFTTSKSNVSIVSSANTNFQGLFTAVDKITITES